jgi:predicted flap endonuclease-1-like 5' DNA nuclease
MEAQVRKAHGHRPGKGFSLSEIRKAGFTTHQVRKVGVYVDSRRRTLHEFNVQTLRTLMEERQKQLQEEVKERMEKEVKEKKVKKEKKEKKVKKKEVKKEKPVEKGTDLTEIKGVGKKRAEALEAAGVSTVEELIEADTEKLAEKTGFTAEYIEKLKEKARDL